MRIHEFQCELWLPLPPTELFRFFADAENLDSLTPSWLHFRIVTVAPVVMREGALIDYRLRVHGIPLRWRTRINVWQPPYRFVDEQIRGPYQQWIHEHTFQEADGGTIARDVVRYAVMGGWLVNSLFVRRDVEKIFHFRQEKLRKMFTAPIQ